MVRVAPLEGVLLSGLFFFCLTFASTRQLGVHAKRWQVIRIRITHLHQSLISASLLRNLFHIGCPVFLYLFWQHFGYPFPSYPQPSASIESVALNLPPLWLGQVSVSASLWQPSFVERLWCPPLWGYYPQFGHLQSHIPAAKLQSWNKRSAFFEQNQ